MMVFLIAYDITSNRRRTRLHTYLKEFGLNTQKSVFECDIEPDLLRQVLASAAMVIDRSTDSVRCYRLCSHCLKRVVVSGVGLKIAELDYMVI